MNNIILVGCSGSIGYNIAKHLLNNGNTVIGIGINKPNIDIDFYKCDVRDIHSIEKVCNIISNKYNKIDGVIYCSGICIPNEIYKITEEDWDNTYNVNVKGFLFIIKNLINKLIENKASVILINSKSGKKGSFRNSTYASSKFAGIGLIQSLALEFAEDNVRFNAICPGNLLESDMWVNKLFKEYSRTQNITEEEVKAKYINLVPMKDYCRYEDINNMIDFLLSNKSRYITGQALNLTGGQQLT